MRTTVRVAPRIAPQVANSQVRLASEQRAVQELSLRQLVVDVQTRNPSLQAMAAAWRSAAQRYPQAVSLDDPMFSAMVAPASFDNDELESAYALQGGQKIPWFGKRAARGRQARAETSAAYEQLEDSRLKLVALTQTAFFDYYLSHRRSDINHENMSIVREFRDTADAKYRANQVTQQDLLQAELELGALDKKHIELERQKRIATARINTLLLMSPYEPLPPPPRQLTIREQHYDISVLQSLAIAQRPDLRAAAAQLRAEQASVSLALKQYYPDMELFGRYDTFWQPESMQGDLRGQVGVNMNMPIYRSRLNAAVREAVLRVSQRRAEYEQLQFDVQYEVVAAYEDWEESRQAWSLFTHRLIPAAEQNAAAAKADYEAGRNSFLELATAQRRLFELREEQEEVAATYFTRLAQLERAVGAALQIE